MTRVKIRVRWLVLSLLSLQGCTRWLRVEALPGNTPGYSLLQLWSHEVPYLLTKVEFTSDSVVGLSGGSSNDGRRMAFARTEVDSVRRGGMTSSGRVGAGISLGIAMGYLSLFFLLRLEGD
jgi:hypothetical protein